MDNIRSLKAKTVLQCINKQKSGRKLKRSVVTGVVVVVVAFVIAVFLCVLSLCLL